MGVIQLTPGQTIKVHGLFPQSYVLTWEHICERKLSVSFLYNHVRIDKHGLYRLQSDAHAWVEQGLCCIDDCDALSLLPLNPLEHLKVPLDKLIGFPVQRLLDYGVTYSNMLSAGMTPNVMMLFHFSLADWESIGMHEDLVYSLTQVQCKYLFGMSVRDTAMTVREIAKKRQP